MPSVLKSGSFNLLEPSELFQACTGIALTLVFIEEKGFVASAALPRSSNSRSTLFPV